MGLAPRSTPRRFDVLSKRLDELAVQQRATANRARAYQDLADVGDLERITRVKAQPIKERLQYAFSAPNGQEHRAALIEQIEDLPPTSPGIANTYFKAKIGIISDLFLFRSFEGLADFKPINPENYMQYTDLDVLLLVSTWRGIDGVSWKGVTSKNSEKRALLFDEILPFFRSLNIPIVFYSKEDPPNYKSFLPFAQQADYIFTSAEEMISKYQYDCPDAKSIDVLPFGINPKHHSPIGSQQGDIQRIVPFAGSWFNHRYKSRRRWGTEILDAVVAADDYDLVIFDRNSSLNDSRYRFPNRYSNTVTPAIDHQQLMDIQRVVDVSINLNSVSNSVSMFANRAIELQAQGTFVLSNYSVGLNSRYPHVHLSNGYTDTLAALNNLEPRQVREIQAAGIRSVYSQDLASMRIAKILEAVGYTVEVPNPKVMILKHGSDQQLEADIASQSYSNIIVDLDADSAVYRKDLYDEVDIVAHLSSEFEYASTHIEDLVNAFRYTDASTVEKINPHDSRAEHRQRHSYAEPLNVVGLGAEFVSNPPANLQPRAGYHIDEVGITPRSALISTSSKNQSEKSPILSVIIPIFNNGSHLIHKCIASLRRSSIFDLMEIVLVDDGSTDLLTIRTIDDLERQLNCVKVHRYESGGSGSASRPRNKGLELASCDYVTYLDPDNEALNDAYVKLLHEVVSSDVDFAVGDMTRWRGTNSPVRYSRLLQSRLGMETRVGLGGPQALVDLQFMPISIQALVARTAWLRETGISQPVGAVGQDSYFFQQMLYYSNKFAVVKLPAHTYYAQVENSVVNTVNAKFFEKYLPLERARSQWLREVGLLEEYKSTRMEAFFTGWYLQKLKDVPQEQRPTAISTIIELGKMYGQYEWLSEEAQEFWTTTVHEVLEEHTSGDK